MSKSEIRKIYRENHKEERKIRRSTLEYKFWRNKYHQTPKSKVRRKRYSQTVKGKEIIKKVKSKRQRNLGFDPVNNYFPNSNAHHINKIQIIYIPKEIHTAIEMRHNTNKPESMIKINHIAFQYLTNTIKQL